MLGNKEMRRSWSTCFQDVNAEIDVDRMKILEGTYGSFNNRKDQDLENIRNAIWDGLGMCLQPFEMCQMASSLGTMRKGD